MAALHINPPENFAFSTPCNWSKWKMRFERYRIAFELSTKTGNEQVNSLLYIMGEQAEDIFSSFGLSETEQDDFDTVLKKFNDHFVKKNAIFECAQFNKCVQLDGESVNTFITALYTLAEHFKYGVLHDELIRDRIVVGIRDKDLGEKLQLDADLTLTKVIERVRLSEVIKKQQEKLIEKNSASVNAISPNKPEKFLKQKPSSGARKQSVKPDFHRKNNENESRLHGKCKCGADHTVLPANVFQNVFQNTKLEPPDKILRGPDRNPLETLGKFKANIEYKRKSCTEEIYVISNLQTCLLGKPALFSLGLVPNLNSICQISAADPKAKFPELFKRLGVMKGCYSIKLKPGATPFAITSTRRVPIPLLKQTKAELGRMVEEKVITPVLKPTEWSAPVVIVPKSDGSVKICVDLVELNNNVMRELHPLPKAEYSLNLLAGAKIFSKLDANSGFWQILLDKKSSYLTTFISPFGRFRFQRLPFGISSAPEHFQRRISQMLEGIPGTQFVTWMIF
ncbi:Transposon Ty3-G Gag-Pol polyprotein [Araneus ventricosus]|uniref:Transposon Ty3-G Gag-Pol polyprotein n=1 Tax=Araneus ventricosus TaxID=182803 RepID=A0A4Y2QE96_ARAVE|nr:Transposon Ty3-G Gag-Pol polyprotein [Araneus ventricosus]